MSSLPSLPPSPRRSHRKGKKERRSARERGQGREGKKEEDGRLFWPVNCKKRRMEVVSGGRKKKNGKEGGYRMTVYRGSYSKGGRRTEERNR